MMHANLAIPAHGSMDFLFESHAAPITELDVLDTTMATLEQVRSPARGGSARIHR